MYIKIFTREFLGNKKNLILFFIIMCIIFTIVGIQTVFINDSRKNLLSPDVELSGQNVSEGISFSLYKPIDDIYEKINELNKDNNISLVKSIKRNIISIENNSSLNKVMYTLDGYEEAFINSKLSNYISDGRLPLEGKNEVLVGSYIKNAFQLKLGDTIGDKSYKVGKLEGIQIPTTLNEDNENLELENYKIVGIIDESAEYFNNSIVVPYNFNGDIKPNKILLYFNSKNASDTYTAIINELTNNKMKTSLGNVTENFRSKQNIIQNLIINIVLLAGISIVIIYLIISYLVKGINKKIGILKALGIRDSIIIKIFIGGLACVASVALSTSILILYVINYFINKGLSDFLGFRVTRFKITSDVLACQVLIAIVLFTAIFLIIKYKTTKISPKMCINKV